MHPPSWKSTFCPFNSICHFAACGFLRHLYSVGLNVEITHVERFSGFFLSFLFMLLLVRLHAVTLGLFVILLLLRLIPVISSRAIRVCFHSIHLFFLYQLSTPLFFHSRTPFYSFHTLIAVHLYYCHFLHSSAVQSHSIHSYSRITNLHLPSSFPPDRQSS